jgi:hypothetical protein
VFHIPGQVVENGIAVSEETVFIVTGPAEASPSNGTSEGNNMGFMYAFSACHISNEDPITTLWSAQYNAGFERKPGGFARGSRTTPTLLGDEYVAITDNAPGYEVFLLNDQNAPLIYPSSSAPLSDTNGPFNNLTTMAPGGVMVSVSSPSNGNDCKIKWQKDIRRH